MGGQGFCSPWPKLARLGQEAINLIKHGRHGIVKVSHIAYVVHFADE